MAPKVKNIASGAGSNRNWKREAFRSSRSWEPLQKFRKKVVERYGHEWFECQKEAKYLRDEFINEGKDVKFTAKVLNCEAEDFNKLNEHPSIEISVIHCVG
ncbi:hypothetical protein H5410_057761 [Solanum commersonii]|uniref:Uncharacterized protein n=1 Tax=Solanum commersonii TaxID=4109 RepID=A0A9J5WNS3_SOLCO|nr:hypothetical protein H5410_057761 [Solanum commersonii]